MADSLCGGMSDEKDPENDDQKGVKCSWAAAAISSKTNVSGSAAKMTETLGFYEKPAVKDEHHEHSDSDDTDEPSLLRFMCAELTRGYFLEHNEAKYTERRERVYTCMRIPRELERLMIFGIFLCLDAFLYVFTLLPLRTLLAFLRLLTIPCCGLGANVCPYCRRSSGSRFLQPAQVCDLLKGLIMVLCYSMMHYVDYAMMYHLIRGQSVIKLYIIYNMLEASTLNVAFNSHNKSLLTIMMSNNFVEIKGSVFKKFEKNNLFQMSNSDIKERFTNYVLLLIVCLRNMEQFSWNSDHLWVLLPDVFMVILSEVAVDVVKHAFITKFNDITADVYSEYKASLAFELVSSRQQNAYTDYSDSVARRMGFIPLPLAVLLIRVVMSSMKIQGALSSVCLLLFYLGLITLKVLNSIVILGKSCRYVKEANMEGKLFERPTPQTSKQTPKKAKPAKSPPPSAEPKVQRPSTSITKQPSPRAKPFPPTPPPVTEVTSDPPPDSPPKPEESSSETPQSTELKHRTTKKDLLEIDRFTICGNRIG
ncbi:Transmembrane anterior posterior transformation protein 1 [Labeo rohita]|uniref:Transmembrane anterior posterior transformation protein 1 n=1 Tax=Labeo rohita TaxID=84645 RepID=A0ABQ8M267_LABRO|nr:Transmembrane anterior posterior transformation protein 1 [Labeo rohita]